MDDEGYVHDPFHQFRVDGPMPIIRPRPKQELWPLPMYQRKLANAVLPKDKFVARLLAKCEVKELYEGDPKPCWVWTGATNKGLPVGDRNCAQYSVRRCLYQHLLGRRPVARLLRNRKVCSQPLCVNPAHCK